MCSPAPCRTLFTHGDAFFSRPSRGCGSLELTFTLLDARVLKPHEEFLPKLLRETREAIEKEGFVRQPILVERDHYIILDGHHRYGALLELGCRRIPVYIVDYFQDAVRIDTWPDASVDRITKKEVVEAVLRGERFPPKTTRHRVELPEDAPVNLEDLF